jgi:hypothetical protein
MLQMSNIRTILPLFSICALLLGCQRRGDPVHFVLPLGYRGAFKLVVDSKGTNAELVGGRLTYLIPPSGTLLVRSDDPFLVWHEVSASFSDGSSLPLTNISAGGTNVLRFASLRSVNNSAYWFFVGTENEIQNALKSAELHVGNVHSAPRDIQR